MDLAPEQNPSKLIIISAGGFGRTIAGIAMTDSAHGKIWKMAGFLDQRRELAAKTRFPILGDPDTYQVGFEEKFICALGEPALRRRYAAALVKQGADFTNLLTSVHIGEGLRIGRGCVFEPDVKVGVDVTLGDFVLVQSTTIIGYEVSLGDYTTVGSFVFIGGRAQIGSDVMIHPHATILPGVKIGDGAVIGAGSVVIGNVPAGLTVMGNPAKPFRFK